MIIQLKKPYLKDIFNDIVSHTISSIILGTSGFYGASLITLRSILELSCNAFFYVDHKIEFDLYKNQNMPADKYVSTLVNDYKFFTTNYIESFYSDIKTIQSDNDSVSQYLKKLYSDLCDFVHGRYRCLTNKEFLKIKYNVEKYKIYEKHFTNVLSIISVMYILRFDPTKSNDLIKLANHTKVVNYNE
jgi:hypothetical protein